MVKVFAELRDKQSELSSVDDVNNDGQHTRIQSIQQICLPILSRIEYLKIKFSD